MSVTGRAALGSTRLDVNKKVRELLGVKPLSFADEETTMDLTGMMIGAVTAFGTGDQPSSVDMRTEQAQVVMGGGNRSSKLLLNPNELTLAKPKWRHRPLANDASTAGAPRG